MAETASEWPLPGPADLDALAASVLTLATAIKPDPVRGTRDEWQAYQYARHAADDLASAAVMLARAGSG